MSSRFLPLMVALLAGTITPVTAQQVTNLSKARVTLVAGPSPTRGGRTEVIRNATRTPRNMIIVDRNATADDLAAALALLDALRLQHGDSLTADFRARPQSFTAGSAFTSGAYRAWLAEQLVRLRKAPEVNVPDLGLARAVDITVTPPRGTISSARSPS